MAEDEAERLRSALIRVTELTDQINVELRHRLPDWRRIHELTSRMEGWVTVARTEASLRRP
ncbi:MAG: hypothetical protein AAGE52_20330 [Myxococcota bacterium]